MSYRYWTPIGLLWIPVLGPMSDEQADAAAALRLAAFERGAVIQFDAGISRRGRAPESQ